MDFHDQIPKGICIQKVCSENLYQNASNHSKLAHKRPKWPNCTKTVTGFKASNTSTKYKKLPRSDFRYRLKKN